MEQSPEIHKDYTLRTRDWLNRRFDVADEHGIYVPNQPSYAFSATAFRLDEYARTFAVLRILNHLDVHSMLDMGCADGYFAEIARRLFKMNVAGADLSDRAVKRAQQLYSLKGCGADVHILPFADNTFDVVVSTEVLEHVTDPDKAMEEMCRIARKAVVISTPRAANDAEMQAHFNNLDPGEPHAHIHYFTDTDMRRIAGDDARISGARTRLFSRIYDKIAWADDSDLAQREAYYNFTRDSTELSENSLQGVRHGLIDRYRQISEWRKRWVQPPLLERLIRWDGSLAARFPSVAHDHLVLIHLDDGVITSPKLDEKTLIRYMLREFYVEPLKVNQS